MIEQEYMKLTQKVKLASILTLLGDVVIYGEGADTDIERAIQILESCHAKINIKTKKG